MQGSSFEKICTGFLFGAAVILSLTVCLTATQSCAADKTLASPAVITGAVMTPVTRRPEPPPAPVFKVRDFGAKGDGESDDTAALRKAIAACAGTGGSVLLEPGTYVSGNLELKGKMTLYLAEGAVLRASSHPEDLPIVEPQTISGTAAWFACKRSLLFAEKADGLRIDGLGVIDGNAETLRSAGMKGKNCPRPSILRVFSSKDVAVRNITMRNALMWTQVYEGCENLVIENEIVRNPPFMKTIDGMDICNCRHVVIRGNDLESDDDVICFKSHGPTGIRDVLVENNTVRCHFANGIKFGTASVGPISDVRLVNNTVLKATGGFCIESVDGSAISDIRVKGLTLKNCAQPIFIRLAFRGAFFEIDPAVYPKEPGSIDDVLIENVLVTDTPQSKSPINSITGLMRKNLGCITLRDMRVVMPGGVTSPVKEPKENDTAYPGSTMFRTVPAYAFFVRHADAVTFEHVETTPMQTDTRPWLHAVNAKVITEGCRESAPTKPGPGAANPVPVKLPADKTFDDRQPYTPWISSTKPVAREGDWMTRSEELAKSAAGGADIAFIGDSITHRWETIGKDAWEKHFASHWKCLNLGIAGDCTEHVLWRLCHGGNLGGGALKPKVFVVLIGTNNAGKNGDSPAVIAAGVRKIVDTLREASPNSKIVLTAIFPCDKPSQRAAETVRATNPLLKKIAEERGTTWFDIGDKLAPGGVVTKEIYTDGLHPNATGYEIWATALEPVLQNLTR